MGFTDALLAGLIAAGAAYILYRSLRKKENGCCGSCPGACAKKRRTR